MSVPIISAAGMRFYRNPGYDEKSALSDRTLWLIRVSIALQFLSGICEGPPVRG